MTTERISTQFNFPSQFVDIYGSKMHYVEAGVGDPILLLHGIPTSNYLWRNVIPHLTPLGRVIAPDLIGFGKSDKPDIQYSISDHIKYIEKLIEALELEYIVYVMHGWGSVIGLDIAMRQQANCKGLAFYEAFLRTSDRNIDLEIALPFQEQIVELQETEEATNTVTAGINYIDKMIPSSIMRELSEDEMSPYREPFLKQGSAKPIRQYIKDLSASNDKEKIDKLIAGYTEKLTHSQIPKLLLYSVPGFVTTIATVMWAKEHLPKLEIVDIGEELHLAQESNPTLIGEAISVWIQTIEQNR